MFVQYKVHLCKLHLSSYFVNVIKLGNQLGKPQAQIYTESVSRDTVQVVVKSLSVCETIKLTGPKMEL